MARRADFEESTGSSAAGWLAREVAALQVGLLKDLQGEMGDADGAEVAAAAERLAEAFGTVTAVVVDAASARGEVAAPLAPTPQPAPAPPVPARPAHEPGKPDRHDAGAEEECLESLHRPGHMRRRLEQLVETHGRYGHPFAIVVFDVSGPGARAGDDKGQETALAVVGAALRDSSRVVDEVFQLEEDALCVLAPNLRTVEGVQMAERLLGLLDELERAGGLRISISAGVAACPEHGRDAQSLLRKADAAMWRARAVGQPVGVGALEAVQDR